MTNNLDYTYYIESTEFEMTPELYNAIKAYNELMKAMHEDLKDSPERIQAILAHLR